MHSGERSKNDPKGSPVSEFRKVSYLFSKDHSQFDIDVEVLATKETSLLKQRPGAELCLPPPDMCDVQNCVQSVLFELIAC